MNMNMIMQQAKKMQKDMEKSKEEVSKMTFTSKQQLVEVTVNGDKKVISIKYSTDVEKEDLEMLEDMTVIALNDALAQADKAMEDKLGNFGAGFSGLF